MDQEEELIRNLQVKTLEHNFVAAITSRDGRDYITPEDITEAFEKGQDENKVRLDVLQILGNTTGFGVEDEGLCAFVAFEGKEKKN